MGENLVDQIHALVNQGAEREANKLKSALAAANSRIAELETLVKKQEEALNTPSPEGQRLIDQARAAVKVHSVRAREAITAGEEIRRQNILLRRELVEAKKALDDVKAVKAEEVAAMVAAQPQPEPPTKMRRSLRRLGETK